MNRIGLISYADDPDQVVFRTVLLSDNDLDEELDNPRWWVEGIDPTRPLQMDKIGVALSKGQASVEKVFTVSEGLEQFAPDVAMVAETVIAQPGEKIWEPE